MHEHVVRWLEPVEAERILCGGVSKDHVRIIEHVQAVERQRVDFQIIQWELGVNVEADICGERASEVFGQAGGRLSAHCENDVGDVAMATVAQLLRVLKVAMTTSQTHHERLGVVEGGGLVIEAVRADGSFNHVELLQLL